MTSPGGRPAPSPQLAVTPASDAASWRAEIASVDVVFGAGSLDRVGELARELGAQRTLIVSDPGVTATGAVARAIESLRAAGVETEIFTDVTENPTAGQVEAGVDTARSHATDLITALGGGSAMDCAKGINFILTNGGTVSDYRGMNRAPKPLLPSLGVPTTAGTGSDAQSYALLTDPETGHKMACGDRQARFQTVVLDPSLLATVPRKIVAASGLDAFAHAVESLVSTRANPISRLFSRTAWRLLRGAFDDHLADPGDAAPAADMHLGAHLAGAAIEQSMLGAAHACANPLTRDFGVRHGEAVASMLPHVVRFNGAIGSVRKRYAELVAGAQTEAPERLAREVERLRKLAGITSGLGAYGVTPADVGSLATGAAGEWTGRFNPRRPELHEIEELYRYAL